MNQQQQKHNQNYYEIMIFLTLKFTIPYNDTDTLDLIIKLIGGPNNIDKQNCYRNPNDEKEIIL